MLLVLAILLILISYVPVEWLMAAATIGGAVAHTNTRASSKYDTGCVNRPVSLRKHTAKLNKVEKARIIGADYALPVVVQPYADKWAKADMTKDYPVLPYNSNHGRLPIGVQISGFTELVDTVKCTRHWGQRKLMLTEIDFLNPVRGKHIVVYAGAADGRHMPVITAMYPDLEFHLYDPRPFYAGLELDRQIRINPYYLEHPSDTESGFFTDAVALYYNGKKVIFISDIRIAPNEDEIELDQRAQEHWIQLMNPLMSMLKFKLPYPFPGDPQDYLYLDGRVRFQCWAPINSAETRLIVTGVPKQVLRDKVAWERNTAWYNTVMRHHDFSTRVLRDLGVCSDETARTFWNRFVPHKMNLGYDFIYELQILTAYLQRSTGNTAALVDLVKKINQVLISRDARFESYLRGSTAR